MLKLSHKRLIVWEIGVELVKEIYNITSTFPGNEKFGLTSQMRRASISVVSNFSEGAARFSNSEKSRFYEIARSSLVELDTQFELIIALNMIQAKDLKKISVLVNEIFAMLSKLCSQKRVS